MIFIQDDSLKWASSVTLNNGSQESTPLQIGAQTNMCVVMRADSATASQDFSIEVYGSNAQAGTYVKYSELDFTGNALTGVTAGAPFDIKLPFICREGYDWVKVKVTAPAAGTIIYDGWITENTVKVLTYQGN
jgi:hypothetical protein